MFDLSVPGFGEIQAEFLVLDFNGTLAIDGKVIPGVKQALNELAGVLSVMVVTADTFGSAQSEMEDVRCEVQVLSGEAQDVQKQDLIERLGPSRSVAIGNGRNDALMVRLARVGICVLQAEGAASHTLAHADIVCTSTLDALDLLRFPRRLTATLRR